VTIFRRVPRDRFAARFNKVEAGLLRDLARQVEELVSDELRADAGGPDVAKPPGPLPGDRDLEDLLGLTPDANPPEDPALARLLPDAYRDDPAASGEFRHYTERDLRAGKVDTARTVLDTLPENGGRVSLSADEAIAWLRALNDIRLALAVRLGIAEDMPDDLEEMGPEDPRYAAFAVYDWLTGMQDSLVQALS
jgi:Domain of unknown function (DUF2017)